MTIEEALKIVLDNSLGDFQHAASYQVLHDNVAIVKVEINDEPFEIILKRCINRVSENNLK